MLLISEGLLSTQSILLPLLCGDWEGDPKSFSSLKNGKVVLKPIVRLSKLANFF
jgi:hypothetical protein